MRRLLLLVAISLLFAAPAAAQSRDLSTLPSSLSGVVAIDANGAVSAAALAYNKSGTVIPTYHLVGDAASLSSGVATVTLSGAAVFTSAATYVCMAKPVQATPASIKALSITYTSGTVFVIRSADTSDSATVRFFCAGN